MKFGILGNFNKDNFYPIFNELGDFLKSNQISFYLAKNKRLILEKLSHKENIYDFDFVINFVNIIKNSV